jgi:hypothetical protein
VFYFELRILNTTLAAIRLLAREGTRGGFPLGQLTLRGYGRRVDEKARLAQSVERLALNQVVVGSSPTVGVSLLPIGTLLLIKEKLYSLGPPALINHNLSHSQSKFN